jgi:hypothetical protein
MKIDMINMWHLSRNDHRCIMAAAGKEDEGSKTNPPTPA